MTLSVYDAYPAGMGERPCFEEHGDQRHTDFQRSLAVIFRALPRKFLGACFGIPQIWGVSAAGCRA
jgi:hypothetical protein